jgi:hypothetical protein
MAQVPLIPTLSSIEDDAVQSAIQILVQYLNLQDSGIQPWSKMVIQGTFSTRVNPISSSYSISDLDQIILVDSTSAVRTVTLPSASTIPGRRYMIKDWKGTSATHTITIATVSSQTIDGSGSATLTTNYQAMEMVSDGANWSIISNK